MINNYNKRQESLHVNVLKSQQTLSFLFCRKHRGIDQSRVFVLTHVIVLRYKHHSRWNRGRRWFRRNMENL